MENKKPLSPSAACAAKCLFAVMKYMKENGGTFSQQARAEALRSKNMLPLKYIAFVGGKGV